MEEVRAKRLLVFSNGYDLGQTIDSTGEQACTPSSKIAGMDDDLLLILHLHLYGVVRYFKITSNSKLHFLDIVG